MLACNFGDVCHVHQALFHNPKLLAGSPAPPSPECTVIGHTISGRAGIGKTAETGEIQTNSTFLRLRPIRMSMHIGYRSSAYVDSAQIVVFCCVLGAEV